jgi:hypothetical protein
MKLLGAMLSKLSGQTQEKLGSGERFPLTKNISRAVIYHMNELGKTDMSKWTFERRNSDYQNAKSDIVVYDANGDKVAVGREENDGQMVFWR